VEDVQFDRRVSRELYAHGERALLSQGMSAIREYLPRKAAEARKDRVPGEPHLFWYDITIVVGGWGYYCHCKVDDADSPLGFWVADIDIYPPFPMSAD